jgi:putative endonuclease
LTKPWWVYVVKCADDSLYTGITTDVRRRVEEHNKSTKGAKYTRSRRPVRLMTYIPHVDRSAASSAEHSFKKLTRKQKLDFIEEFCVTCSCIPCDCDWGN